MMDVALCFSLGPCSAGFPGFLSLRNPFVHNYLSWLLPSSGLLTHECPSKNFLLRSPDVLRKQDIESYYKIFM